MSKFLFEVEERNRLEQRGLLKRFSMKCIGNQPSLEDIRAEKSHKFKELKKGSDEYEMWFLKYNPREKKTRKRAPPRDSVVASESPEPSKYRSNRNKTMKRIRKITDTWF
jgi:hypothetical protein